MGIERGIQWAGRRGGDRRGHLRQPWSGRAQLFLWDRVRDATLLDVGSGGLQLQTSHAVEAGRFVTVRVELDGLAPFTALCRVVRSEPCDSQGRARVALAFRDVPAWATAALAVESVRESETACDEPMRLSA